jgi:fumarate reductase flavoprotein subunit
VLACNGYGGNPDLVRAHIPDLAGALYFGHPGNTGEAVLWGEALGADLRHMPGHQGHGSVAHPHGILITWAVMMEGGFQVNLDGRRFSDESRLFRAGGRGAAPARGLAWNVFDARIAAIARQFEDFRTRRRPRARSCAADSRGAGRAAGLPPAAFAATCAEVAACRRAPGRSRSVRPRLGRRGLSTPRSWR